MEERIILYENYKKINSSFTGYLKEGKFNGYAYHALCSAIEGLRKTSPKDGKLLLQIHSIYSDILHTLIERGEDILFDGYSDFAGEDEDIRKACHEMDSAHQKEAALLLELEKAAGGYIRTFEGKE